MASIKQCDGCGISLEKQARKDYHESNGVFNCLPSYRTQRRQVTPVEDSTSESDSDDGGNASQDDVKLDLASIRITFSWHGQCIMKTCPSSSRLTTIPHLARKRCLQHCKKFIPKGAKCCVSHFQGNYLPSDVMDLLPTAGSTFKAHHIDDIMNLFLNVHEPTSTFDSIKDSALKVYTGRSREEFNQLVQSMNVASTYDKKRSTLLGVYLTYLYAGFTQEQIGATFDIPRTTVEDYIRIARGSLGQFVSSNLGIATFSRRLLWEHRTKNAEILYGLQGSRSIVTSWDATYEYMPKSSNFRFQSASYSANKSRNLLKPMVAVTPDRFIVDIFGPDNLWRANISDGDILKQIMQSPQFESLFQPGDVFVLDRGFKSARQELESKGFVVKIPPHLAPRQKQLTWEQANQQRMCTAVRWIVEVTNRSLKCNKYLARTLSIQAVPHLLQDTKIAAAIHNRFGTRMEAYSDSGTW